MALRSTCLVGVVLVASLTGACGGDGGKTGDGDSAGRSGSAGDGAAEHQSGGAGSLATAGSPSTGGTPGSGGAVLPSGGSSSPAITGGTSVGGSSSGGGTAFHSGGAASHSGGTSPDTGGSGPLGSGGAPASGGSPSSGGAATHSGGQALAGSGGTVLMAGAGGRAIGDSGGFGGESPNGGAAGSQQGSAGTAGGALDFGGAGGSAGAPQLPEGMECTQASDCRLARSSCDCVAVLLDEATPDGSGPPCAFDPCAEYGVSEEDVTCLRGRCTVGYTCGFDGVICASAPPECAEGQTPSALDGCWGPCVPTEECAPSPRASAGGSLLEGVWLMGSEGGQLHFSVLRFPPEIDGGPAGELEYLAEPTTLLEFSSDSIEPYINYSGTGIWQANERLGSFWIGPRSGYDGAFGGTSLTFTSFADANGRFGSTLAATLEVGGDETTTIEGFWFPAEACNEDMTVCAL